MDMTTAALGFATAALYLFAGKQTFLLMLILDPEGARCPLTHAYRNRRGDWAFWITFGVFLLLWPVLFGVVSFQAAVTRGAPDA